ncbi:hypothetical protein NYO91_11115 [Arhodomonas aquaeolei]|uniref:four-carbon acid sugar kinase family protein n=1 Tax=Arhodomonas aquaeolei TaxID=2369 RepID=UPI0021690F99|nr:four-carbon acid sugar kinase family protein [Arhodomonas aquaeolei]MCS4504627.1 hypothetical protein [Arhodomonas aquaeolei]
MTEAPLLAYYGDDFTGSTDVMEALSVNGVPTVLFLRRPTAAELARFPEARAVGIAGISRAKSPAWMDEHLPGIFAGLRALGAPLVHYKICSTFDSAPEIGSIGRAIDIGARVLGTRQTPVVVGAPVLRRYQAFGNLFATVGDETYRIDRHPTMSCHPVTPMTEGDLRRHLARQTDKPVALMDVLALWSEDYPARHCALLDGDAGVLLYDVLDDVTQRRTGELLWRDVTDGADSRFCVGSSGVEYALIAHWRASGAVPLPAAPRASAATASDRVMVVSGSCSPVTAGQIRWALENGFEGYTLDPAALLAPQTGEAALERAIGHCSAALEQGRSVVAFSSLGAPDKRTRALFNDDPEGFSHRLGRAQGRLLTETLRRTGVRRAVVAGGDTSGHAMNEMGAYALTTLTPIAPGSPLCTVHADDPDLDGLQIALKGGQVGQAPYFAHVRAGHA